MGIFDFFASKPTATVESITTGIDAVQAQIDELKAAVEVIKTTVGPTEVVQAGGYRKKKTRQTMKNRRRK